MANRLLIVTIGGALEPEKLTTTAKLSSLGLICLLFSNANCCGKRRVGGAISDYLKIPNNFQTIAGGRRGPDAKSQPHCKEKEIPRAS